MNVLDAIRRMCRTYPGGVDAVAPRLGKSPSTLEKELRGAPGFKLGALDAAEISAMCFELGAEDALAYATALAAQMGCVLVPLPPVAPVQGAECMRALAKTSRESAELIAEAVASLDDGAVSDNELRRIDGAIGELVGAAQVLRGGLASLNLAGKPIGLQPGEGLR